MKRLRVFSFARKVCQVIIMLMIAATSPTVAQQYGKSAGIRLGDSGITFKKFIVEEQAYEMILSNRKDGIQFTLLYMNHVSLDLSFTDHLFFFYGVGGHLGYEEHDDIYKRTYGVDSEYFEYENKSFMTLGLDGVAGIEYRMLGVPMTVSLDILPYVNYTGFRKLDIDFWNVSVGVKYIF